MKAKALAYGLLIGGAVGAATALLSAPLSGKELRNQIKDSKDNWIRMAYDLKEDVLDIKDSVTKLSDESKVIIKELASDVKIAVNEWQNDIEPNKNALQKEMQEIQKTIADLEEQLEKNKATS
ncbi:YtxH domain-containing protein [Lederbergia lenta]|uniref:Putative acid tolerance protein n=1 Tax=Lederbergia lenta TaxID=1467 RepID=A0A2X4WA02_LEDLE|nr:YtxH domain-containing protein [Lederbergia lenta]MCM3110515.1 YtxH domain-containing protein [Lederbergia lenta]MEC2323919.1 YtxH domain-containing protein [Lederbergia lenta]SQI61016.1 putative acid tolerance protein [Lederbergia lenta]